VFRLIQRFILRVLIDHLSAISGLLTRQSRAPLLPPFVSRKAPAAEDLPFLLRVVLQCLLPDTPPALVAAAQALSTRASERLSADAPRNELEESCPACARAMPLDDMTSARCPIGHIWRASL
jgi:hypothetical protein